MLKEYLPIIIVIISIIITGLYYEKYNDIGFVEDIPSENLSIVTGYKPKDENLKGIYRVALNHYKKREFEKAAKIYEQILIDSPDEVKAHKSLGTMLIFLKDFTGAENSFNNALKLAPNTEPATRGLANVASWRKDYKLSISLYKEALSYRPNYVITHSSLANQYYIIKDYPLAIKHYKKVIKLLPDSRYAIKAQKRLDKIKKHLKH